MNTDNGTIDEWGEWVYHNETNTSVCINCTDGVVENIRQNNPAITDVTVHFAEEDGMIDCAAAGESIGNSKYITSLNLEIHKVLNSLDRNAFFEGLALNRSIKCLEICIEKGQDDDEYDTFTEQVLETLLPFFRLNSNLLVFELVVEGFPITEEITSLIYDAISAAKWLKSIHLLFDTGWEEFDFETDFKFFPGLIFMENLSLRHLSLQIGSLTADAYDEVSRLLSNEQCSMKSLALNLYRDSYIYAWVSY